MSKPRIEYNQETNQRELVIDLSYECKRYETVYKNCFNHWLSGKPREYKEGQEDNSDQEEDLEHPKPKYTNYEEWVDYKTNKYKIYQVRELSDVCIEEFTQFDGCKKLRQYYRNDIIRQPIDENTRNLIYDSMMFDLMLVTPEEI